MVYFAIESREIECKNEMKINIFKMSYSSFTFIYYTLPRNL